MKMAYRKFKRGRYARRARRGFKKMFRRRVRRIAMTIAEKKYYEWICAPGEYVPSSTTPPADMSSEGDKWKLFVGGLPRSLINTMPNGFGQGQRIGNKIFVEYVQLSFIYHFLPPENPTMSVNGCLARYGVYIDKKAGGQATPGNGLLSILPGVYYPQASMRAYQTLGRYKTLLDRQTRISYPAAQGGSGIPAIQHYIPIKRTFNLTSAGSNNRVTANMIENDLIMNWNCSHPDACYAFCLVRVCYRDA